MRHFAIALAVAACSPTPATSTSESELITLYPNTPSVGTAPTLSQEPSGAFADSMHLVVGFNDGASGTGWAVSSDGGSSFSQSCSFNGTAFVGSCSPVPIPSSGAACSPGCSGATPFCDNGTCKVYNLLGDPTVVADRLGRVVYISQADTDGDTTTPEVVTASLSTDGGATFTSSVVVNDIGCNNGMQDQPNATFDYTTFPPTLWVVWRHAPFNQINGGCIRRGRIGNNTIQWLDDPQDIEGMGGNNLSPAYQGGLWVAAGDGRVTVMYNAFTTFMPKGSSTTPPCPDGGGLNGMIWGTVDSFDNGHDWVDNARVFQTNAWQWCVIGSGGPGLPGAMLAGQRAFSLARGPGGVDYAVLQDTRNTIRFFMSPAASIKGWENVTNALSTWFEWCPGTPTSSVMGGPTWNWRNVDTGPCAVPAFVATTGLDVAFPTLAVDTRGRVMVSFYEETTSAPGSTPTVQVSLRGHVNPQDPLTPFFQPPVNASASFPLAVVSPPGRGMGDYMWMAVRPPVEFGGTEPPGCGPNRFPWTMDDFFPLWTQPLIGATTPNVVGRGTTLAP